MYSFKFLFRFNLKFLNFAAKYIFFLARCLFQFDSKDSKVGNFSSPDYPEKYTSNIECFYNFIGDDYETLKLTFYFFDLEPPYSKG